ncbi:hypothetical protein PIROE2DRAFT_12900 [Piromyces sp. E2]|nr:hypothetical protein PIROE2DRAFT_12900 [Piromyces sp. E2]|eukprot:OUM61145.1 hypothetical protein PIROE2DRAFT_12900 [Piromyces sp. E2]
MNSFGFTLASCPLVMYLNSCSVLNTVSYYNNTEKTLIKDITIPTSHKDIEC